MGVLTSNSAIRNTYRFGDKHVDSLDHKSLHLERHTNHDRDHNRPVEICRNTCCAILFVLILSVDRMFQCNWSFGLKRRVVLVFEVSGNALNEASTCVYLWVHRPKVRTGACPR